jgi:hypothetical protein
MLSVFRSFQTISFIFWKSLLHFKKWGAYVEPLDSATDLYSEITHFSVNSVAFLIFVSIRMIVFRGLVMSINRVEHRKWLQCVQRTVAFIWTSLWGSKALRRKYALCRRPVCSPAHGSSLRVQVLLTNWSGLCTFSRMERNLYKFCGLHVHFLLDKDPSCRVGGISVCF